jgi:hypothetical protein
MSNSERELAMMQVSSLSRCTGIRVVFTPAMKSHEAFCSPHRSSSDDAGGGGQRRHDRCFKPRFLLEHDLFGKPEVNFSRSCSVSVRKKRKAERRQTHNNRCTCRCSARPAKARSPIGVPPRFSPEGFCAPMAQLQARLPGTWSDRVLPAFACPSPVEAPHALVVMPASMMPGAARE